jgi:hypothetical protein
MQSGSDLGSEFALENLPCRSQRASTELKNVIDEGKYDINLLPATSTHGKPIKPTEYNDRLAGALVLTEATPTSDLFATKGFHFYTDIASFSILRPPKTIVTNTPANSPSKKRRFQVPQIISDSRKQFLYLTPLDLSINMFSFYLSIR